MPCVYRLRAHRVARRPSPARDRGIAIRRRAVASCCSPRDAAFIIATTPSAGDRVESGFEVKGCSRTFESNVNWRLVARNGTELARGSTQEGGVDGPGPFAFTVAYTADQPQIGHLELFEEDASDGEGFPPGRIVLPLILKP